MAVASSFLPDIACHFSRNPTVFRELFVGFRHYFKNYLSDFDILCIFTAENQ